MTGDDRALGTAGGRTEPDHHHHHWMEPSGIGTVVLDIGGDTGALIIHTGPECHGKEIEISPVDAYGPPRRHAAVRERHLPGRVAYSVVYDGLPAGEYDVWHDAATPAGRVTVHGATVTEFRWPSATVPGWSPPPNGR